MRKILYIILLFTLNINAQQLAFPSAYGAGAYSAGGRGAVVLHVINLNDSGAGSLRWALTDVANASITKTIVFDISGVITLSSDIVLSSARTGWGDFAHGLTIAGQTAPLGGITITGGKIRMFDVDNVIVRYLKFRETTATDGCLSNTNGNNVIFDHLSGSHTPDIVFALTSSDYTSDNKTLQHCLMAQSKNGFITGDTTPIAPATEYFEQISILRNAYYNVGWRIPLKGGARIRVDAINNIAHNWDSRLTRMDGYAYELNHIGNYYQGGYNTTNVLKHCGYLSTSGDPKIYNLDNYMDPAETTSAYLTDESVVWTQFQLNFEPLPTSYFTNIQNPIRGRAIPILASSELKAEVLPEVGAFRYIQDDGTVGIYRDTYDTAFVNGINIDDDTSRSTALTTIETLSNTRAGTYDTDNDGMADVWETATFGDLTRTGTLDFDSDGYTDLEEFLNLVDGAAPPPVNIPVITLVGASTINLNNGDTYTELGATANDVEDGSLTGVIATTGTVNTAVDGTYSINYNVTDSNSNNAIQVTRTIIVTTANGNINYNLTERQKRTSKRIIKNKLIRI